MGRSLTNNSTANPYCASPSPFSPHSSPFSPHSSPFSHQTLLLPVSVSDRYDDSVSHEPRFDTNVVSTSEAAQILQCSSDNVRRLARTGKLVAAISTRAGRLFRRRDVEKLLDERRASADQRQGGGL